MKHYILGCLSACLAGVATAGPPELDWLVGNNTAARGGAAAIESVSEFEAEIHIVEPTFEVDGVYVATRDGRMRVDILAGGERVFTEALDHDRAWSWSPASGTVAASEKGRAALQHGIELPFKLFGLHEMTRRGHQLEIAGREHLEGVDYHVLRLKMRDGFETLYYVNPATWLIDRDRQHRALHVDVDPVAEWIETSYLDYRAVGGVQYPHRQVERRLATGEILSTTTVRSVRLNDSPGPGRFSPEP
jgi:hypothetical protein